MSDQKQNKPKAVYNPGELDKTRKNIGEVSKEEALRVAKLLGGQVGVEKSIDTSEALNKRKRTYAHKNDSSSQTQPAAAPPNPIIQQKAQARTSLPFINSKEKSLIDKLMASPEYRIKPNYGFLSFIMNLRKGGTERVLPDFVLNTLHNHLGHIQKFNTSIKHLVNHANETYKQQIKQTPSVFFKTIKFINEWDLKELRDAYAELEKKADECTVTMLIPFTRILYRSLLTIYFLGDTRIISYIKKVYADIIPYITTSHETLFQYAKDAASEWLYINGQIVKGLYPLLLRMSCAQYEEYSSFFTTRISKILTFLDMTKYDLILPGKEQDEEKISSTEISSNQTDNNLSPDDEEAADNENKVQDKPDLEETKTEKKGEAPSELIKRGIELLDTLFPEAGWNIIHTKPDMYPYFQTLYSFTDGFNLIAPENPMQITMILQRILEDFFVACRNIKFSIDKEPDFLVFEDNLTNIFSEWSLYREQICERLYLSELKDYVNHIYTQSDFGISPYAKKKLSNLLWQTKYLFLPHLSFELIFMERPDKDATYRPMPKRVEYLKSIFSVLISRVDQSGDSLLHDKAKANEDTHGAANLFAPYRFDVPNVISRRIDVLLGGKKSKNGSNLNLLKYTLCIIAVLDWWINNAESPGYIDAGKIPYRVSKEDGSPIFSVPTRNDQNTLFLNKLKTRDQSRSKTNDEQK